MFLFILFVLTCPSPSKKKMKKIPSDKHTTQPTLKRQDKPAHCCERQLGVSDLRRTRRLLLLPADDEDDDDEACWTSAVAALASPFTPSPPSYQAYNNYSDQTAVLRSSISLSSIMKTTTPNSYIITTTSNIKMNTTTPNFYIITTTATSNINTTTSNFDITNTTTSLTSRWTPPPSLSTSTSRPVHSTALRFQHLLLSQVYLFTPLVIFHDSQSHPFNMMITHRITFHWTQYQAITFFIP